MRKRSFIIYALHHDSSPRMYVGKSCAGMTRPAHHGCAANMKKHPSWPVVRWIKSLRDRGEDYRVSVLEEAQSAEALTEAECFFIAYFRSLGIPLLNCTDGGEGAPGYRHTEEARKKMSKDRTGRRPSQRAIDLFLEMRKRIGHVPMSLATRQRMAEKRKGKPLSAETRAKMSASRTGMKRTTPRPAASEETRAKLSAASKGRRHSEAAKAKMSAAKRAHWLRPEAEAWRKDLGARNFIPEMKAKIMAGARRPEAKAKRKASMDAALVRRPELRLQAIATLMRPDVRERAIAGLRLARNNCIKQPVVSAPKIDKELTRARQSEAAKVRWKNSKYRALHGAGVREFNARPEQRARRAAIRTQLRDRIVAVIAAASPPILNKTSLVRITGMNFVPLTAIWNHLLATSMIARDATGIYRVLGAPYASA